MNKKLVVAIVSVFLAVIILFGGVESNLKEYNADPTVLTKPAAI